MKSNHWDIRRQPTKQLPDRSQSETNLITSIDHETPSEVASSNSQSACRLPTLAQIEWDYIRRVLALCEGNVSRTARLLGLHRRSLQRKITKHLSEIAPNEQLRNPAGGRFSGI